MCLLYSNRMDGQFSLNLPLDTQIKRFALVMMTPLEFWHGYMLCYQPFVWL